ncbi:hypothetical protein GSI_10511 [Ganoderma sinense ZZ0214-1]|uniref:Cytochrome P450 n=1 Tax=Ganoderma sinense ZZ0214-1 TaxID=1077348 RepID=A0A2G8S0U8_9APHY|nr:hypothetical protein GSI_10511 [Ganoderma sinense ZZ0214-1]
MFTPVFSIKHLRNMLTIFYELVSALSARVDDGPRDMDILHWMSRAALELIGQAGVGYSFDRLVEDEDGNPFAEAAKTYLPLSLTPEMVTMRNIIVPFKGIGPQWLRRWVIENFPHQGAQDLRKVVDTLHLTATRIVNEKKAELENGQRRDTKDIISILSACIRSSEGFLCAGGTERLTVQQNMKADEDERLPDDQGVVIRRDGSDIGYPTAPLCYREAHQDAVLPISKPIRSMDGKMIDSVFVPKGTQILASTAACNRRGEDADEWKPERWLKGVPSAVEAAHIPGIYFHMMTFLGGGHSRM